MEISYDAKTLRFGNSELAKEALIIEAVEINNKLATYGRNRWSTTECERSARKVMSLSGLESSINTQRKHLSIMEKDVDGVIRKFHEDVAEICLSHNTAGPSVDKAYIITQLGARKYQEMENICNDRMPRMPMMDTMKLSFGRMTISVNFKESTHLGKPQCWVFHNYSKLDFLLKFEEIKAKIQTVLNNMFHQEKHTA